MGKIVYDTWKQMGEINNILGETQNKLAAIQATDAFQDIAAATARATAVGRQNVSTPTEFRQEVTINNEVTIPSDEIERGMNNLKRTVGKQVQALENEFRSQAAEFEMAGRVR